MIRAVIFDLDGVLVDADRWHFEALNLGLADHALPEIAWQEHLTIYKGLPTTRKLAIYSERNDVDIPRTVEYQKRFWTPHFFQQLRPDPEKVDMLRRLSERYPVVVCSNAIRASVDEMLDRAGLAEYVAFSLSNEDVTRPKPDPSIYREAFARLKLAPDECLVVEDSDVGKAAAVASGARLCSVDGPADVNVFRVEAAIRQADTPNVVIPAAGQGKRFAEKGYIYPKPLIDVGGDPMLQVVLDNLSDLGKPIVLAQRAHLRRYAMRDLFSAQFVPVQGLTEGAACTVLLAKRFIDNSNELVLANSDQCVRWLGQPWNFIATMRQRRADGGIITFRASDPKWSYVQSDQTGLVRRVAEKQVISDQATVGIYYFRRGSDFVRCAEQMIEKDIRVNGEFYVCPVFNELIGEGGKVYTYEILNEAMVGLGTPEDLEVALADAVAA